MAVLPGHRVVEWGSLQKETPCKEHFLYSPPFRKECIWQGIRKAFIWHSGSAFRKACIWQGIRKVLCAIQHSSGEEFSEREGLSIYHRLPFLAESWRRHPRRLHSLQLGKVWFSISIPCQINNPNSVTPFFICFCGSQSVNVAIGRPN